MNVWAISVSILAGFCFFVGAVTWGATSYNNRYYNTENKCIESGGTFIPVNWGICLKHY